MTWCRTFSGTPQCCKQFGNRELELLVRQILVKVWVQGRVGLGSRLAGSWSCASVCAVAGAGGVAVRACLAADPLMYEMPRSFCPSFGWGR